MLGLGGHASAGRGSEDQIGRWNVRQPKGQR